MIGREHRKNPTLGFLERKYISAFGYPALGLHVRAKAIMPLLMSIKNPVNVLDAGCGNGSLTFAMARLYRDASITGIDMENALIQNNAVIAARLKLVNCSFMCKDVFDIDPVEHYDLILSTDNLEHVQNDAGLLRLFYQALKNGGVLILHVPHITRHVFGTSRPNFMEIEGHKRPGYTKNHLEEMLRSAGFTISISQYNYNSFETLFNDISFFITGGKEKNRQVYALVFPFLLLLTKLLSWTPKRVGSGLVIKAEK